MSITVMQKTNAYYIGVSPDTLYIATRYCEMGEFQKNCIEGNLVGYSKNDLFVQNNFKTYTYIKEIDFDLSEEELDDSYIEDNEVFKCIKLLTNENLEWDQEMIDRVKWSIKHTLQNEFGIGVK